MGYYYKMSLFVLFMSLILNTSLVINNTSSMYSDDYLTHVRALFDDDDSDEDYNSDSDSDNDYDRECGIPNCDECSYNNTCYVCNSGFYLSETNTECIPCEDSNCYRCISSGLNTCTECNYNYILFGYSCVSSYDFPREHKVSKCEAYNINYKCILCANDCTLESNGKCNCKKSNNAVVITIVVIVVAVILAIVIFVLLYLKRKKRNKATTKTTPVQVVPIQEKYAKQYSLNNNACEAKPAIMDHNRGSNGDLICSYGIESDNKVLCCECNKDNAIYELSCGCCFCVNHVGCFKEFPCEKNKCSKCNKEVSHVNKLGSMCNICLEMCKGLIRFDCGCQFEVCGHCYNKCVKEQKCPGCRRNISNNPITVYN